MLNIIIFNKITSTKIKSSENQKKIIIIREAAYKKVLTSLMNAFISWTNL
jgi:hypothetical protein